MHDLAALVLHFHFFTGITLILLASDLRDQVEGNLIGEHLRLVGFAMTQRSDFLHQLHGAACARAGHGLIGGGSHVLDRGNGIQCVDGSDGDNGGAVGVGDDAAVPGHILGIDLGHHQRHLGIQTERGGVIHKYRAGFHNCRGELLGDIVFRRAQHDVHTLKSLIAGLLNGYFFTLEGDGFARAPGTGQWHQLSHGEIPLSQNFDHFLPHGAGGAQNGNGVGFHHKIPPKKS